MWNSHSYGAPAAAPAAVSTVRLASGVWTLGISLVIGLGGVLPAAAQQVVSVRGRQFALDCSGDAPGPVVVVAASGGALGDWAAVQKQVALFAKFCVYEPPGSDRPRNIDEMAEDLDGIVAVAAGPAPVVLVGYSLGGILARRYAERYPSKVAGFIFIDSAHEEQLWRFGAIAPSLLDFQFGRSWHNPAMARAMGMLPSGQRLTWHADQPLIALEHGAAEPPPPAARVTPAQAKRLESEWRLLQQDLATRSPHGELRKVEKSGSRIQQQQPATVAAAIREVVGKAR